MAMMRWDLHRWDTSLAFIALSDYLEMIEGQFHLCLEIEQARMRQDPPTGLDESQLAEWQSTVEFTKERYERDFPSKIRYSFLVLVFSTVEDRLKAFCDEISARHQFGLLEEDFRGTSAIERSALFLGKAAKLAFKERTGWPALKEFQKIRNCVVHANGKVHKGERGDIIRNIARHSPGLAVDAQGYLSIDRQYCTALVSTMERLFDELYEAAGFGPPTPVIE